MENRCLLALILLSLSLSGCNRTTPDTAGNAKPVVPTVVAPGTAASTGNSTNPATGAPPANQPQAIVKDLFQENPNPESYQNMTIVGVKPAPVDLPGTAWQLAGGDGAYETNLTPPGEQGYHASFHNVASAALSLANAGPYTKPVVLTLSADLSFAGDTPGAGCCLLGFYSALSGGHNMDIMAHFTGLALQKDGSLQLVENGVGAGTAIKYTGKFDPDQIVTLTYSIDISKGTISNILLSGSTSAYAFTSSAFTSAATAFLAIGGSTDGQSASMYYKLQLLSGVVLPPPPPAPDSVPTTTP